MMNNETATLAGGCFWCTEAVFRKLKGVTHVTSGYSGGWKENPTYHDVSNGQTGHAEAIQIEFDPTIISFETLLEVFFTLHNPTTPNQQGNDIGPQYRSAIFYHNSKQKNIAEKIKKKIISEKIYNNSVVTEITPFTAFYRAETYHQRYYENNNTQPYCRLIINPKITKLSKEFADQLDEH
jgi:peptide-methionine (S)-S-oxide reductase